MTTTSANRVRYTRCVLSDVSGANAVNCVANLGTDSVYVCTYYMDMIHGHVRR